MRIYPVNQAKVVPEDVVFRESRVWMVMGLLLVAIFPAVGVFLLMGRGPKMFGWYFTIVGALVLLWMLWKAGGVFSAGNWVVRIYGQRILIKIGMPRSDDPARVFVAEFQAKEMEWVRVHRQVTTMREGGEIVAHSYAWLELKPREMDLAEVKRCVQTASAPRVWRGWQATTPMPVSVTSEGVVRVEWSSKHSVLAPSLKRAVAVLGEVVPVMAEVMEREDFTKSDADKKKLEQRIMELVERGEMIEAVKVARGLYGFSLAEAKAFVEELRGGDQLATNELGTAERQPNVHDEEDSPLRHGATEEGINIDGQDEQDDKKREVRG
jgi:ribosomal protein L7/L12